MTFRKGNKQNAILNGEWAKHVRKRWKKLTSRLRRIDGKNSIIQTLNK